MMRRTVALFHSTWPAAGMERSPRSKLRAQYYYAVWYKANPRDIDYMRALAVQQLTGAEWIDTHERPDWKRDIAEADRIVLLYPDAIGLGFTRLERFVLGNKRNWASVEVLNGRRRRFRLNKSTRFGLRLRRALEWSMFSELLFLSVFVLVTPFLAAFDMVRGRR